MQDPKSCRDHARKCLGLAESFPEGSARRLFAEMDSGRIPQMTHPDILVVFKSHDENT
jgi:hypothetical protein